MSAAVEWLPNEPLFHHVLEYFTANPDLVFLNDSVKSTKATYSELLVDMILMRHQIIQSLPSSMLDARQMIIPERPFFLIIAPGNYDFIVAAFSILCCGAAFSSLPSTMSPEQASYVIELSNASCVLYSSEFEAQVSAILQYQKTHKKSEPTLVSLPIVVKNQPTIPKPQIQINNEMVVDPSGPGLLSFTSGTTGTPKGVVRPRSVFYNFPETFPAGRVQLFFRPPTWNSVTLPLIWRVLHGSRIEYTGSTAHEIWERLKEGDVMNLSMAPNGWGALMRYFIEHVDKLPSEQREQYVKGVRALQRPTISGAFAWPRLSEFWREMLGRPFNNAYGSTEAGMVLRMLDGFSLTTTECVGIPQKGVQIKLSEGDHGEMLIKSPSMFTGYFGNERATQAAFDEDGFFRSGDFARRVGDEYFLEGRMATDFMRLHGSWISLREVEDHITKLPYISEAYAVSATFDYIQQVAVVVRMKTPSSSCSLRQLRADVQGGLRSHQLPTLFRILREDEHVPETDSGKLARWKIAEKFFALSNGNSLPFEVQSEEVDDVAAKNPLCLAKEQAKVEG